MRTSPKSIPEIIKELWELLKVYARQETVDPLRSLGRYLGFGLAGSALMALGLVLLSLSALRALQDTTSAFTGFWSWVPYLLVLVALVVVIGIAVSRVTKAPRRQADGAS